MDSGLFSQQSSLDDEYSSQQPSGQELSATASSNSCSGGGNSGPLEDYTKCNTSLPPVALPAKVMEYSKTSNKGLSEYIEHFSYKGTDTSIILTSLFLCICRNCLRHRRHSQRQTKKE